MDNEIKDMYVWTLIYYLPATNGYKFKEYQHISTGRPTYALGMLVIRDMDSNSYSYSKEFLHSIKCEKYSAD